MLSLLRLSYYVAFICTQIHHITIFGELQALFTTFLRIFAATSPSVHVYAPEQGFRNARMRAYIGFSAQRNDDFLFCPFFFFLGTGHVKGAFLQNSREEGFPRPPERQIYPRTPVWPLIRIAGRSDALFYAKNPAKRLRPCLRSGCRVHSVFTVRTNTLRKRSETPASALFRMWSGFPPAMVHCCPQRPFLRSGPDKTPADIFTDGGTGDAPTTIFPSSTHGSGYINSLNNIHYGIEIYLYRKVYTTV